MNTLTGILIPKNHKKNFVLKSTFKEKLTDLGKYQYLLIGDLDSVYLLYLYDKNADVSYLMQSKFGFYLPIYYGEFGFSTSLKKINDFIHFKIDYKSVLSFIFKNNYYLDSKRTFVNCVYKLAEDEYLEIQHKKGRIKVKKAHFKNKFVKDSRNKIVGYVENSLLNLSSKKTNLSLSGGSDSNLIFQLCLKNNIYTKIYTTSIRNNRKDATTVSNNLKRIKYPKPKLIYIDKKRMSDMLNVVWITEGLTISQGFLLQQYNLLKMVRSEILYGTGADLLFSNIKHSNNDFFYIKQVGLIANYFGVKPIFPFLDVRVMNTSESLSDLDKTNHIYKKIARNVIDSRMDVLDKKDIITNDILVKIKYVFYFYKLFISKDKRYLKLLSK